MVNGEWIKAVRLFTIHHLPFTRLVPTLPALTASVYYAIRRAKGASPFAVWLVTGNSRQQIYSTQFSRGFYRSETEIVFGARSASGLYAPFSNLNSGAANAGT